MARKFMIIAFALLSIVALAACANGQSLNNSTPSETVALPPSLLSFPVALDRYAGTAYPAALTSGILELQGGYLILSGDIRPAGGKLIVWPAGFSVREQNGRIVVVYPDGQTVINLGDRLDLGGGEVSKEIVDKYIGAALPDGAPGPYWLTGSVHIPGNAVPSQSSASPFPASPTPTTEGKLDGRITDWKYDFPRTYNPELNYMDTPSVSSAEIDGKDYLILSFDPSSGPNNSRIFVFDLENPPEPRLVSTIARPKQDRDMFLVRTMAMQGDILYAGLFADRGTWMVDLSDPENPVDLGIAAVPITNRLIVQGNYAYGLGQMYNGISIADVSDPQNVQEVARLNVVSRDCRIALSGDILVIGYQQTLTIVDISQPESPETISTYELAVPEGFLKEYPGEPHSPVWDKWASIIDLQVSGNYVYVAFGARQLRVVDISDPTKPREASSFAVGDFAIALSLQGDLLYLTKSDKTDSLLKLRVLDVSEPENPKQIGAADTQSRFGFGGVTFAYCFMRPQVIGEYAYVAGLDHMDVIRIR
jgi:hypothetical protein